MMSNPRTLNFLITSTKHEGGGSVDIAFAGDPPLSTFTIVEVRRLIQELQALYLTLISDPSADQRRSRSINLNNTEG